MKKNLHIAVMFGMLIMTIWLFSCNEQNERININVDTNQPIAPTIPIITCFDSDGDGFSTCANPKIDCNDNDPIINPTAAEIICNGIDENCNGLADDTVDVDGDGFNTCANTNFDCNDNESAINPKALEITCNGVDENCNGMDDDAPDTDKDYYDICGSTDIANLDGRVADCNDNDLSINPGAEEKICNDVDENCDGDIGPQSIKLYSIDKFDGNMISNTSGWFGSFFGGDIQPWYGGFFTFDIETIDWKYVDKAEINAYILQNFPPCAVGNSFYPPKFRLNNMADEYYNALSSCNCTIEDKFEDKLTCLDLTTETECQYLYYEVYPILQNSLTPSYFSGPPNQNQTTNLWKAKVTDNFFAPIGNFWTDLDKKYISIFPDKGECITCSRDFGCYSYEPTPYSFVDGGDHGGSGNVPYLEITCQP